MAKETVTRTRSDSETALDIQQEVLLEVNAIADTMLRTLEMDPYNVRTFGMRLRELTLVMGFAIDNANESSVTWKSLEAQLSGLDEDEI